MLAHNRKPWKISNQLHKQLRINQWGQFAVYVLSSLRVRKSFCFTIDSSSQKNFTSSLLIWTRSFLIRTYYESIFRGFSRLKTLILSHFKNNDNTIYKLWISEAHFPKNLKNIEPRETAQHSYKKECVYTIFIWDLEDISNKLFVEAEHPPTPTGGDLGTMVTWLAVNIISG